jgi:hypothetical protein
MRRTLLLAASALLVTGSAVVALASPASAAPKSVTCPNGFLGVLHVRKDLIVPADSSCGLTQGSKIGRNVIVHKGASFFTGGTKIGGNLIARGAALIEIGDVNNGKSATVIGGNVIITGTVGGVPYGEFICQTRIGGNLVIKDTAATASGWDIGQPQAANCGRNAKYGKVYGDTIGHNGIFIDNAGAYLDVGSNQPAFNGHTGPGFGHDLVFVNNHEGYNALNENSVGHDCRQHNNRPYEGSGNMARHKLGDCNSKNS